MSLFLWTLTQIYWAKEEQNHTHYQLQNFKKEVFCRKSRPSNNTLFARRGLAITPLYLINRLFNLGASHQHTVKANLIQVDIFTII